MCENPIHCIISWVLKLLHVITETGLLPENAVLVQEVIMCQVTLIFHCIPYYSMAVDLFWIIFH